MAVLDESIIWVDFNGRTRQTMLRATGNLANINTQQTAISNAGITRAWAGTESNPGGVGTAANFQNVADYAQLIYTDGVGNNVYITIPAPKASIFLADLETVDATKVAALTAQVVGNVVTAPGNAVTAFVGGVRRRSGREYQ